MMNLQVLAYPDTHALDIACPVPDLLILPFECGKHHRNTSQNMLMQKPPQSSVAVRYPGHILLPNLPLYMYSIPRTLQPTYVPQRPPPEQMEGSHVPASEHIPFAERSKSNLL